MILSRLVGRVPANRLSARRLRGATVTESAPTGGEEMPERTRTDMILLAINSVRDHGLKATLRKIRVHADNAMFDRRYGVHSNQFVATKDLTVAGGNKAHGTFHQPIKPLVFKAAMDAFQIPRDGVFVDFGSGTGRALMLAVLHGFTSVVGVEYAANINPVAERNLEEFRRRTGKEFDFRIVGMDAAEYEIHDDERVFFFYNPFGRPVFERVLGNIRRSYESSPRPIHLVYGNPTQRQALEEDPFWVVVKETGGGGLEEFIHVRTRR
jgi:hypothetical protein